MTCCCSSYYYVYQNHPISCLLSLSNFYFVSWVYTKCLRSYFPLPSLVKMWWWQLPCISIGIVFGLGSGREQLTWEYMTPLSHTYRQESECYCWSSEWCLSPGCDGASSFPFCSTHNAKITIKENLKREVFGSIHMMWITRVAHLR